MRSRSRYDLKYKPLGCCDVIDTWSTSYCTVTLTDCSGAPLTEGFTVIMAFLTRPFRHAGSLVLGLLDNTASFTWQNKYWPITRCRLSRSIYLSTSASIRILSSYIQLSSFATMDNIIFGVSHVQCKISDKQWQGFILQGTLEIIISKTVTIKHWHTQHQQAVLQDDISIWL